jgi:8-oxo-dGTP diphosphatase
MRQCQPRIGRRQRGEPPTGLATHHHGHAVGTLVRMTCYTADYQGVLRASGEIEEIVWLTHADRHRVAPVDQIIFDHLRETALLR